MTDVRAPALLAQSARYAEADAGADEAGGWRRRTPAPGLVIKGYVVDPADLPALEGLLERWPAPAAVGR